MRVARQQREGRHGLEARQSPAEEQPRHRPHPDDCQQRRHAPNASHGNYGAQAIHLLPAQPEDCHFRSTHRGKEKEWRATKHTLYI